MFLSGSAVLSRAAAFGGAEAAAELALQTRHERLLSARPARAGPRSQQTDLLLILPPQEGLPVAYVVRLLQIPAHQIVAAQAAVMGRTAPGVIPRTLHQARTEFGGHNTQLAHSLEFGGHNTQLAHSLRNGSRK